MEKYLLASGSFAELECSGSLTEVSLLVPKHTVPPDTMSKNKETPEMKVWAKALWLIGCNEKSQKFQQASQSYF